MIPEPERRHDGGERPLLVWRLPAPWRAVSSAPLGGGVGERGWVLNAQVGKDYDRTDVEAHLEELAAAVGVSGPGVGMLTAASLDHGRGEDGGVVAWATVGVTHPTWAADADGAVNPGPGTINVVAAVPVALGDAALVNAVITATEAKSQAVLEAGVEGTGTASDAVCILAPGGGATEAFGGPRSVWGARLARAVHAAVAERLAAP